MTYFSPAYRGRQWVTSEAERDVRPAVEAAAKDHLKQVVERDGMRLLSDPEVRWRKVWRVKLENPELGILDMLRDEDFELRVWVYAEPA